MIKQFKTGLFTAAVILAFASCKKDEEIIPATSIQAKLSAGNTLSATKSTSAPLRTSTNWMRFIADNTNISEMSIPGTHDAAARIEYFPGTTKCQSLSIAEQLNIGVRYLDIRCRHIGNAFAIHHGDVYQKQNFTEVLNACYSFLRSNPSETILMCVKEEYNPSGNNRSFEETFDSYTNLNPAMWNLDNKLSSLSELRGKIKLIRRFKGNGIRGVQATSWGDNKTFDINFSAAKLRVQDNYQVSNINTKWSQISSLLSEAQNSSSGKLYLNYTSGYKSMLFGISNIPTVSNSINAKTDQFFSSNKHGKFGIMALDFISANSSKLIYDTNF